MSTTSPPETVGPGPGPAPVSGGRRWSGARVAMMALGGLALAVVAVALVFRTAGPHLYSGTVLQSPDAAPDLDGLTYADGQPVELAALEGEAVVLFFGYTNCPDVCPTTLSTLAGAVSGLDEGQRDRVEVLMVSVDPERDDLATLQSYVEFFDPDFRGVGGDVDAIERAAAVYGVYHQVGEATAGDDYTVDHTATLMGIDTDGRLRVLWPPDIDREVLAADMAALLS